MATLSITRVAQNKTTVASGDVNTPFTEIEASVNDITNAQINSAAAIVLSKLASDAWTAYTPTYTASGSMTYTSVTTNIARYIKIGRITFFELDASGTTGGTASTKLIASLPVTAATGYKIAGVSIVSDGGVLQMGFYEENSTTQIEVFVTTNQTTNWGLGASRRIIVNGYYESAS